MPARVERPARLERIRCALARDLFRNHLLSTRITLALIPKHHPFRLLVSSAIADLSELTTTTLRPRNEAGDVKGKPSHRPLLVRAFSPVFAVKLGLGYILLSATSMRVPDGGLFGGLDEQIRVITRLEQALNAFLAG